MKKLWAALFTLSLTITMTSGANAWAGILDGSRAAAGTYASGLSVAPVSYEELDENMEMDPNYVPPERFTSGNYE